MAIEASAVHQLEDARLQVLAALAIMRGMHTNGATSAEVSDLLRDECGVALSRQRVAAILSREKTAVARRSIQGKKYYKIMKSGENDLEMAGRTAIFVEPETGLTKIRQIESFFNSLTGMLRICDPYIDNHAIDILVQAGKTHAIRLLTVNVLHQSAFSRDLGAFITEHGNKLEVRIASKQRLHDRYLICDQGAWQLGTSLNGLGKKQSLITPLGNDLKEVLLAAFDREWHSSTPYK